MVPGPRQGTGQGGGELGYLDDGDVWPPPHPSSEGGQGEVKVPIGGEEGITYISICIRRRSGRSKSTCGSEGIMEGIMMQEEGHRGTKGGEMGRRGAKGGEGNYECTGYSGG